MIMYILRGLPGSGKSTKAQQIAYSHGAERCVIVSADHFFERLGRYDPRRLTRAHAECQLRALEGVMRGQIVIVDNTNVTRDEMWFYRHIGDATGIIYEVRIVDLYDGGLPDESLAARCVHGVPARKIGEMRARWEP